MCYKEKCKYSKSDTNPVRSTKEPVITRVKQSKSRELRASRMYVGCGCEKKNGLQDQCPRTDCLGSPECLTQPYPICGPSEFCNAKHLEKKRDAYLKRKYPKQYSLDKEVKQVPKKRHDQASFKYKCFPASLEQNNGPSCYLVCECPK